MIDLNSMKGTELVAEYNRLAAKVAAKPGNRFRRRLGGGWRETVRLQRTNWC